LACQLYARYVYKISKIIYNFSSIQLSGDIKMKKIFTILICLLILPALSFAEEKQPTLIADMWGVTPKAGHEAQLHAALKAHTKFREEKNDPRSWQILTPIVGKHMNSYIIRACCFEWSSQDAYAEWSKSSGVQKHWRETADPHVASYNHNFIETDAKNSHWPADTVVNYVGLTRYKVKNSSWKKLNKAISSLSSIAKDNKWPHSWSWGYPVSGHTDMVLAIPFENYAAMAPLEENFFSFISKQLKSEKKAQKMFDGFTSSIESSHYTIYKHLKDLSMKPKK